MRTRCSRRRRSHKANGITLSTQSCESLGPLPIEQPPLRLVLTIGPGAVGAGVNGMNVGVGCGGTVHTNWLLNGSKAQINGSSQSVFF